MYFRYCGHIKRTLFRHFYICAVNSHRSSWQEPDDPPAETRRSKSGSDTRTSLWVRLLRLTTVFIIKQLIGCLFCEMFRIIFLSKQSFPSGGAPSARDASTSSVFQFIHTAETASPLGLMVVIVMATRWHWINKTLCPVFCFSLFTLCVLLRSSGDKTS